MHVSFFLPCQIDQVFTSANGVEAKTLALFDTLVVCFFFNQYKNGDQK